MAVLRTSTGCKRLILPKGEALWTPSSLFVRRKGSRPLRLNGAKNAPNGYPLNILQFLLKNVCMGRIQCFARVSTVPEQSEDKELTRSISPDTFLQSRTVFPFLLLPHGECGVRGKAPLMGQGTCPLSGLRGRQPPPSESVKLMKN